MSQGFNRRLLGFLLESRDDTLQTDCPLVAGDSGGPLFDLEGKLIGVNSRIGGSTRVNLHVPVDVYHDCWERLAGGEAWDDGIPGKDSGQIKRNYLGVTTTRMPRSTENDYLPLEAIHLIDGNRQTCWMSRAQTRPDVQPIWIRLDLPRERVIDRVVLRKRPPSDQPRSTLGWVPIRDAVEVGRGVPATISVKLSRDNRTWETVYDGPTDDSAAKLDLEFRFTGRPAKQIWITAGDLPLVENILYAFSLAEVEVYDAEGKNVAIATRRIILLFIPVVLRIDLIWVETSPAVSKSPNES